MRDGRSVSSAVKVPRRRLATAPQNDDAPAWVSHTGASGQSGSRRRAHGALALNWSVWFFFGVANEPSQQTPARVVAQLDDQRQVAHGDRQVAVEVGQARRPCPSPAPCSSRPSPPLTMILVIPAVGAGLVLVLVALGADRRPLAAALAGTLACWSSTGAARRRSTARSRPSSSDRRTRSAWCPRPWSTSRSACPCRRRSCS